MARQKVTYTIPEDIIEDLNTFIEQRQRSHFVSEAIRLALEFEKKKLEEAYKAASEDKKLNQELEEWSNIDIEGFDE